MNTDTPTAVYRFYDSAGGPVHFVSARHPEELDRLRKAHGDPTARSSA